MKRRNVTIVLVALAALLFLGLLAGGAVAYAAFRDDSRLASVASSVVRSLQGEVTPPGQSAETAAPVVAEPDEPGLVIVRVLPDGPAAAAGIQRGDILLEIEGEAVNTLAELRGRLGDFSPGDTVGVTVMHGDDRRILSVKLGGEDTPMLGLVPWAEGPARLGSAPSITIQGVEVLEVLADSPAAAAGLQKGDRITAVNGETLSRALADMLRTFAPGDTITLGVERGDATVELTVTLGEHPDDATRPYLGIHMRQFMMRSDGFRIPRGDGMPFNEDGPRFAPAAPGALVVEVMEGSGASAAGLQFGDLITAVNGVVIPDAQALRETLAGLSPGDTVTLTVHRGEGEPREVEATLGENDEGGAYLGVRLAPHGLRIPGLRRGCDGAGEGLCLDEEFFEFNLPELDLPSLPFDLDLELGGETF